MLDTCDGFLLLLHSLAFGVVSKLNGSIWFFAISVSRQSVSRSCVVNVGTRCISIHLIFSKVSMVYFNGRLDIWLCPIILWVQGEYLKTWKDVFLWLFLVLCLEWTQQISVTGNLHSTCSHNKKGFDERGEHVLSKKGAARDCSCYVSWQSQL